MDEKYLNGLKLYKLLPTVMAMAKMSSDEDAYKILSYLRDRRIYCSMTHLIKVTQRFYKAANSSFSNIEMREEIYIAIAIIDSIISKKRSNRRMRRMNTITYRQYNLVDTNKWKKDRLFPLPDIKYREYI